MGPIAVAAVLIGGLDDFVAREIQHAAVKRLQADADLLLSDGSGHRKGSTGSVKDVLDSVVEVQIKCKRWGD